MQVRILAFGILKESLGPTAALELPEGIAGRQFAPGVDAYVGQS